VQTDAGPPPGTSPALWEFSCALRAQTAEEAPGALAAAPVAKPGHGTSPSSFSEISDATAEHSLAVAAAAAAAAAEPAAQPSYALEELARAVAAAVAMQRQKAAAPQRQQLPQPQQPAAAALAQVLQALQQLAGRQQQQYQQQQYHHQQQQQYHHQQQSTTPALQALLQQLQAPALPAPPGAHSRSAQQAPGHVADARGLAWQTLPWDTGDPGQAGAVRPRAVSIPEMMAAQPGVRRQRPPPSNRRPVALPGGLTARPPSSPHLTSPPPRSAPMLCCAVQTVLAMLRSPAPLAAPCCADTARAMLRSLESVLATLRAAPGRTVAGSSAWRAV
jgi:hypothetical protein